MLVVNMSIQTTHIDGHFTIVSIMETVCKDTCNRDERS